MMDDGLLMDLFVVKGGRKKKLHSVVWYKKKKRGKNPGKNSLSKSERKTVLQGGRQRKRSRV